MQKCTMASFLSALRPGVYLLNISAKPGARSSSLVGPVALTDATIEVRVAAPPVEGQANAELIEFMHDILSEQLAHWKRAPGTYMDGTSYAKRMATAQHASASTLENTTNLQPQGKGAAGKKSKTKLGKPQGAGNKVAKEEEMPSKVSVSLARGGTSRTKTLQVEFPAAEEVLIAVLEKAASES